MKNLAKPFLIGIALTLFFVSSVQAHDLASLGYASMKTKMSKNICKQRAFTAIRTEFKGGQFNRHKHGVAYYSPRERIEILCTTAGNGLVNYVAMVSLASNERRSFQLANDLVKGISRGVFE